MSVILPHRSRNRIFIRWSNYEIHDSGLRLHPSLNSAFTLYRRMDLPGRCILWSSGPESFEQQENDFYLMLLLLDFSGKFLSLFLPHPFWSWWDVYLVMMCEQIAFSVYFLFPLRFDLYGCLPINCLH